MANIEQVLRHSCHKKYYFKIPSKISIIQQHLTLVAGKELFSKSSLISSDNNQGMTLDNVLLYTSILELFNKSSHSEFVLIQSVNFKDS